MRPALSSLSMAGEPLGSVEERTGAIAAHAITLAVHPGSGSERKNWPEACWAALLERLAPRPGLNLLLLGGEAEGDRLDRLARLWPADRLEAARSLPLVQVAERLAASHASPGMTRASPTWPRRSVCRVWCCGVTPTRSSGGPAANACGCCTDPPAWLRSRLHGSRPPSWSFWPGLELGGAARGSERVSEGAWPRRRFTEPLGGMPCDWLACSLLNEALCNPRCHVKQAETGPPDGRAVRRRLVSW